MRAGGFVGQLLSVVQQVAVDVGAERPLLALATVDGVDRLDLDAGTSIVATWTATATRAIGHTPV